MTFTTRIFAAVNLSLSLSLSPSLSLCFHYCHLAFHFGCVLRNVIKVLSATDPVAVVALFNTLGVSPRLTMSPGLQFLVH